MQAISGNVYVNGAIFPTSVGAPASINFITSGGYAFSTSLGADGSFYDVIGPAHTIPAGSNVLATIGLSYTGVTDAYNGVTSPVTVNAATIAPVNGTSIIAGVNLVSNVVTVPTSATTLSTAAIPSLATAQSAAIALDQGNASATAAINATTSVGLLAQGNFTIDRPVNATTPFVVSTTNGGTLTVAAPINVASGSGLALFSAGDLTINAPITVDGTGSVALSYMNALSIALTGSGFTASLTYLDATGHAATFTQGGTLVINETPYTLVYSMADLNQINTALGGAYALASNVDASSSGVLTSSLIAPGVDAQPFQLDVLVGQSLEVATPPTFFTGTFEGLGHTISNLNVSAGAVLIYNSNPLIAPVWFARNAALFGGSTGIIRDVGVVGGTVSGYGNVGALVGENDGVVFNAFATGNVTGYSAPFDSQNVLEATDNSVGGLVGLSNGTLTNVFATGAVTMHTDNYIGSTAYPVGGTAYVGGLVGQASNNYGFIYGLASGGVTNAYATGAVSVDHYKADAEAGGLIGDSAENVTNVYATGAVQGGNAPAGLISVAFPGTVSNAYSTGAVTGFVTAGFIASTNNSSISQGYFDTQTSGQTNASVPFVYQGAAALTTAQLQGLSALPDGGTITDANHLGSAFAGGTNGLYPYLKSFFPNGVQAVSGTAYTNAGTTPLASPNFSFNFAGNGLPTTQDPGLVSIAANGASLGTASTGANGYYYLALPAGTLPAGATVVAYTNADPNAVATPNGLGATNAASYASVASSGATPNTTLVQNLNIYGGWQFDQTAATALSAVNTADTAASAGLAPTGLANRQIVTTASAFSLDTPTSLTGSLVLSTSGSVTQTSSGAITAGSLGLEGTGGAYTLTDAGNTIPTLAANTGSVALQTSGALSVGAVGDATGATITGLTASATSGTPVSLVASGGGLTLTDGVTSGAAILLASDGPFTNNVGAGGVVTGSGSAFTIYSQDPTNPTTVLPVDTLGGLTGTNYYNDAYSFPTGIFASAVPTGNYFVTAYAASLAPVLSGSAIKPYDGTTTATTTGLTVSGSGFANLDGLTDTASFSSTFASYDTANAGPGKTLTLSGIGFASNGNPNNYTLVTTTASAAVGTINQAALSYTIGNASQTYGTVANLAVALPATIATGVNGETINLAYSSSGSTTAASVGSYAITGLVSNGTGLASNYAVTLTNGMLTVNQRAITVAANAQTQIYGNATPTLTYTDGGLGLANNDTLSGSLATTATSASNVGNYAITQGTLTASTNYAVTYTGANDVIGTRAITVAADAQTQVYGNATPTLTYTVGGLGLANNDTLSGVLTTTASATSNIGSYAITQGTLAASTNYAVTYTGANLGVTPASITVTALGGTSLFGTTPANPGLSATGLKNGETVGVLTGLSNSFGITAATPVSSSPYLLSVTGTLTNANYTIVARGVGQWLVTTQPVSTPVPGSFTPPGSSPMIGGSPDDPSGSPSDPRFDKPVVCVGGICTVVALN